MVKMIVVDLDGTILNNMGIVSKTTKEYLKRLKDNGYIIVIATGRIYASAISVTDGAEFANYIISDTGVCTYNTTDSSPIFKSTISKEIVERVFKYYNEDCYFIDVCDKNTIYKYANNIVDNNPVIKITNNKEYILNTCAEVTHISISMKNNDAIMNLYDRIISDMPELDIIIMQDSFAKRKWIEALPKGCSKYSAIKKLANYLNISNEDIIAFGDGLNDVEMLEKCGRGVALKNALPEAKEVADATIDDDHNHDGVLHYLEKYLLDD